MKGLINKPNRKFLAANCLLIAAKLNDITKKGEHTVNIRSWDTIRFDDSESFNLLTHNFSVLLSLNVLIAVASLYVFIKLSFVR